MGRHSQLADSQLHEPKHIQTATGGATDVGKVIVAKGDGTSELRKLGQSDLDFTSVRAGFWDYNDAGTAGTPINVLASTPAVLTNDEAGANTNKTYKLADVTDVWDALTDSFDWSELSLGDMVDIRVDATVTTTSANQRVQVYLQMAQGDPIQFDVPFVDTIVKTAGAYQATRYNGVYIGSEEVRTNPAQLFILSDSACTVVVSGWYVRVTKRSS